MSDFEKAVKHILQFEGGYVNHPNDPGGETKYGISKRAYPNLDIASLTEDEAKEIYRKFYWEKCGCDKLEWPLSLVVFDTAVQHGYARAMEMKDAHLNWTDIIFARLALYARLNRPMFLPGWVNRMVNLYRTAKS